MSKMETLGVISFILFVLAAQSCSGMRVKCIEQEEVCECPQGEKECKFDDLKIDELQTFTSYEIRRDDLLTKGVAGDTYYMDSQGFQTSVPDIDIPERGNRCYFTKPLIFGYEFINKNCSIPTTVDGVSYRSFIAINGRIPGPTLIVDEGSLVKVRVVNRLTSEGITIHWHGMHQRGTPWMDGVGFISQPPIGPGAIFDYIFNATPAGTHWYHSHVGAQRTDGLFGALVIREKTISFDAVTAEILALDPSTEYAVIEDIPSEHTFTLLDWQREASLDLFVKINSALGFYSRDKPVNDVPTDEHREQFYGNRTESLDGIEVGPIPYWSGLINGRGKYDITDLSTYANLSLFYIRNDRLGYRFRVIGAQSLYAYSLSIDDHRLRVIATDGHFIEPVVVDFLIIHSGERYDFIPERINTQQPPRRKYWIRAETLEVRDDDVYTNFDPRMEHSARAILIYGDAEKQDTNWTRGYSDVMDSPRVCTDSTPCQVLNCLFEKYPEDDFKTCICLTNLSALPIAREEFPPIFDSTNNTFFFNLGFEGDSFTSAINGRNFKFPATPYQTYCNQYNRDREESKSEDSNTNVCDGKCRIDGNETVDCTCTNVVRIVPEEDSNDAEHKTVLMVFSAVGVNNNANFSHPVHLHGHSFYVLHIGYGNYSDMGRLLNPSDDVICDNMFCMKPSWGNGVPSAVQQANNNGRINSARIRKDTVILPAGGYVVVAIRADNPGYWFLHCHIEVHQLEGMGVLIEEFPYEQHKAPPDLINRHGNFLWNVTSFKELEATCGAVSHTSKIFFVGFVAFYLMSYGY